LGYAPAQITFFALSHYHDDHTGNSNDFAGSTWLVQRRGRDAMFSEPPPAIADPRTYGALKNAKTVIIENTDYDVFGDGSAVLKYSPGHTPGSQMLFLKLAKTGPVLLTGDTYSSTDQRKPPYDSGIGAANNTSGQVLDLLLAVDARSHDGRLYDLNGDGRADSNEAGYRVMANDHVRGDQRRRDRLIPEPGGG